MALKSVKTERRRLADQVYDQLVEAIFAQEIDADDRLVQEKLAAEMEISRTPVREALIRLEKEGVLEIAGSGGFRLARISQDDIIHLYQARAAVEVQAARILTARAAQLDFAPLRALIARNEAIENPSVMDYFVANRAIHRAFVEMTGNRFLCAMFDDIWGKGMAFHLFTGLQPAGLENSFGDHMALVDTLEQGDLSKAHEVFTAHIQDGYDLQLAAMQNAQKARA